MDSKSLEDVSRFSEISTVINSHFSKILESELKASKIKIKYDLLKKISKTENLELEYLISKYLKGWKFDKESNKLINVDSTSQRSNSMTEIKVTKIREEDNDINIDEQEHLLTEVIINGKSFWRQDSTNDVNPKEKDNKCKIFDSNYNIVGHIENGEPLITE